MHLQEKRTTKKQTQCIWRKNAQALTPLVFFLSVTSNSILATRKIYPQIFLINLLSFQANALRIWLVKTEKRVSQEVVALPS